MKKKTLLIIAGAVLVSGIGFGAGMLAKSSMAAESQQITVEEAKSIALSNVGVSEEKATFTKAKLDDDGYYEIDFYTASTEYDFEIDPATGDVLDKDTEPRDRDDQDRDDFDDQDSGQSNQPVQPNQSGQSGGSNDSSVIGVEAAKSAALKHAGLTSASFHEASLDHDDGTRVYELEFSAGGYEYDYEINAYTGAIIEWDKERFEYDD